MWLHANAPLSPPHGRLLFVLQLRPWSPAVIDET